MARMRRLIFALLMCLPLAMPAAAQVFSDGRVQSAILTIDFEAAFNNSAFGQRIAREIEAEGAAIAAQNREIEAELTAEESQLTEQRATLSAEEFRELAEAFDQKVQALRREQDTKARALGAKTEESQRQFLVAAEPVLRQILDDTGASIIVERRSVLLSVDAIDITELAIQRINASIGDGAELVPTDP